MSISLIAAVGKQKELGLDGDLVFHIKEDMEFFRQTTLGHPVLMGRKTFASIGKPLPGRQNYVVTRHPEDLPNGVEPVRELRQFLAQYSEAETELFVIGGESIYKEALPYAKTIYLTEIEANARADVFFPDFDATQYERRILKEGRDHDLVYAFVKYTRK